MRRENHFSTQNDFRTGIFSKLFFVFSIVLVIFLIFIAGIGTLFSNETNGVIGFIVGLYHSPVMDILLAFLIITVGLGGILYFFKKQFAKLDEISKEVEDEMDSEVET